MPTPKALILRAPGTNCDDETVAAWALAGAEPVTWHVNRLLERPAELASFQVLTIPGGVSYGDDLGAGRILAARLAVLGEAIAAFRDRGGLILGICNGFQVLVRSGLLPGPGFGGATLTRNDSGHFEGRWTRLAPVPGRRACPFLDDGDEPIEMPAAHGEGKFLTADPADLDALERAGQVVLRYVDAAGKPTQQYPANPNGSPRAIAGICDATGRILGLMPHPERHIEGVQHPRWMREGLRPEGAGLRVFRSAVRALASA
jgi:phosphoribosylformylglycinamidine synthase